MKLEKNVEKCKHDVQKRHQIAQIFISLKVYHVFR